MTEKELIEKKREQIEKLKKEIADLQGVRIGDMIKNHALFPSDGWVRRPYKHLSDSGPYSRHVDGFAIKLSMELFRKRLEDMDCHCRQSSMSKAQKRECAKLCDKIISIFNKYIIKEYGEEYQEYNEEASA